MAHVKKAGMIQNETIEITDLKNRVAYAAIQSGPDVHANTEFELRASWDGAVYLQVDLVDPADPKGATIAKITGASKAGYAEVFGALAVQLKRLDANAGDGTGHLNTMEPRV